MSSSKQGQAAAAHDLAGELELRHLGMISSISGAPIRPFNDGGGLGAGRGMSRFENHHHCAAALFETLVIEMVVAIFVMES